MDFRDIDLLQRRARSNVAPHWPPKRTSSNTYPATLKRFGHAKLLTLWTWVKGCFQFGKRKRQREASDRATILEFSNAEYCPIYRLPPELLLEVLKQLPRSDISSLSLSSRRFLSLIPQTQRIIRLRDGRTAIEDRLARDRFFRLAEAEPRDLASLSHLLCSYCRKSHCWSYFDRKELQKPARNRRCIGASRIFRACGHLTLNRDQLIGGNKIDPLDKALHDLVCTKCEFSQFFRSYFSRCLHYYRLHDLNNMHASMTIYRSGLQEELRKWAEQVCPHMRTDDENFQAQVLSVELKHPPHMLYGHGGSVSDVFAEPNRDTRMTILCKHEHCYTEVDIERSVYHNERKTVSVSILRTLGDMKSADDPVWLAQIEDKIS